MREDLRRRLEAAAAERGTPAEALLSEIVEQGLDRVEAELAYEKAVRTGWMASSPRRSRSEPEHLDALIPPALQAVVAGRPGWQAQGRGYVPEPKAPRLFRARREDGIEVASQMAFGPEPGPTLSVTTSHGHAWLDLIMPLRWIVLDLVPRGWEATLDAAEDAARRLRAGEKPPERYGTNPDWGYPVPVGDVGGAGRA